MGAQALLRSLAPNSPGQLHILWHDSDSPCVNGAQVGVLKEPNKIRLCRLLKSQHGGALESQVGLEILSDFTHKPLEGQLSDQELGRLLILSDLPKSYSSRPAYRLEEGTRT